MQQLFKKYSNSTYKIAGFYSIAISFRLNIFLTVKGLIIYVSEWASVHI